MIVGRGDGQISYEIRNARYTDEDPQRDAGLNGARHQDCSRLEGGTLFQCLVCRRVVRKHGGSERTQRGAHLRLPTALDHAQPEPRMSPVPSSSACSPSQRRESRGEVVDGFVRGGAHAWKLWSFGEGGSVRFLGGSSSADQHHQPHTDRLRRRASRGIRNKRSCLPQHPQACTLLARAINKTPRFHRSMTRSELTQVLRKNGLFSEFSTQFSRLVLLRTP